MTDQQLCYETAEIKIRQARGRELPDDPPRLHRLSLELAERRKALARRERKRVRRPYEY